MNIKKISKLFFIALGITIVIVLANKLGFKSILNNLKTIGWSILPIFLITGFSYVLYTFAWNEFLKKLKGSINLWELFRAKIAGEAVNTVTPAGFVGGDPVRIYILKKHFPLTEGAASVVVDRTLQTIAVLAIIFIGMVAAFWKLPFLPLNLRYGLPIVLIISAIFVGFIFAHQRRGIFGFLLMLLKKLHIKKSFSETTLSKLQELDGNIADFYINNPKGFWIALSLHFCGRVLGIVEIFVIGKIFYPEFTISAAVLLGALAPLINFLFAFIPGALGIMEGAYSGVLYLLNMPPEVGLSIQIFRRIRTLFWILVGFIALSTLNKKNVLRPSLMETFK